MKLENVNDKIKAVGYIPLVLICLFVDRWAVGKIETMEMYNSNIVWVLIVGMALSLILVAAMCGACWCLVRCGKMFMGHKEVPYYQRHPDSW